MLAKNSSAVTAPISQYSALVPPFQFGGVVVDGQRPGDEDGDQEPGEVKSSMGMPKTRPSGIVWRNMRSPSSRAARIADDSRSGLVTVVRRWEQGQKRIPRRSPQRAPRDDSGQEMCRKEKRLAALAASRFV